MIERPALHFSLGTLIENLGARGDEVEVESIGAVVFDESVVECALNERGRVSYDQTLKEQPQSNQPKQSS